MSQQLGEQLITENNTLTLKPSDILCLIHPSLIKLYRENKKQFLDSLDDLTDEIGEQAGDLDDQCDKTKLLHMIESQEKLLDLVKDSRLAADATTKHSITSSLSLDCQTPFTGTKAINEHMRRALYNLAFGLNDKDEIQRGKCFEEMVDDTKDKLKLFQETKAKLEEHCNTVSKSTSDLSYNKSVALNGLLKKVNEVIDVASDFDAQYNWMPSRQKAVTSKILDVQNYISTHEKEMFQHRDSTLNWIEELIDSIKSWFSGDDEVNQATNSQQNQKIYSAKELFKYRFFYPSSGTDSIVEKIVDAMVPLAPAA